MVIERGEVAVTALGNTIRVGGGAVIFHPPGVIYKHFTSSNELYERYRIRFYPELLDGVSENVRDCISAHTVKTLSHSDFEDVLSLTRMLHKRCQGEGQNDHKHTKYQYPAVCPFLHFVHHPFLHPITKYNSEQLKNSEKIPPGDPEGFVITYK